jgi:hypothetical protein
MSIGTGNVKTLVPIGPVGCWDSERAQQSSASACVNAVEASASEALVCSRAHAPEAQQSSRASAVICHPAHNVAAPGIIAKIAQATTMRLKTATTLPQCSR